MMSAHATVGAGLVARRGLAPGLRSRAFTLLQLRAALHSAAANSNTVYVDVDAGGYLVCAGGDGDGARVCAAALREAGAAADEGAAGGGVEAAGGGGLRVAVWRGVAPHHELRLRLDAALLAALTAPAQLFAHLAGTFWSESEVAVAAAAAGTRGRHACVFCGKLYSRRYGLKIHIRTHTGYRPLRCPHCARPFGDPSNLNKHVRLHARLDAK